MRLGLALALLVRVRQLVRQIDSLQGVPMVVIMMEVHGIGASPRTGGHGGGGEQARPGVERPRQLHAAGVVARKRAVSSSSGFPDTLDGLCTGHLSRNLINLAIRGEAVCRSESDSNRWTSEGIEMCQKQAADATPVMDHKTISGEKQHKVHSEGNVSFHFKYPGSDCLAY